MAKKHGRLQQALAAQQASARRTLADRDGGEPPHKSAKAKGKAKAPHAPPRPRIPFHPTQRILLVGEGNFSFTLSLVRHHLLEDGSLVIATAYDTRDTAATKYDDLDHNVEQLEALGVTVIFEVDAGALEKVRQLKGRLFEAIVFNFPHVGAGEKDRDRNIRLNQVLLLRFLRSCPPFLLKPVSGSMRTSKRKRTVSPDDEVNQHMPTPADLGTCGHVFITLRNAEPYTLWDVPLLAKKGPSVAPMLLPHPLNRLPASSQPVYRVERSFDFPFDAYPGYAHRRTIGFQRGFSTEASEDARLPTTLRRQDVTGPATGGGGARTWQLAVDHRGETAV